MQQSVVAMIQTFYQDEMNDYLTYQTLVEKDRHPEIQRQMTRIAGMERRHAEFWQSLLTAHAEETPPVRIHRLRLWCLRVLRLFLNPVLVVSLLELGETRAVHRYLQFYRNADLDDTERQRLRRIIIEELEHEMAAAFGTMRAMLAVKPWR